MFVNPIEIKVNGKSVQPGSPQQQVDSLEIYHVQGLQVPKGQGKQAIAWVEDLVKKCKKDYITYQGVLILKEDILRNLEK